MAGVGEVSAIASLIAIGAQLSKTILDVAGKHRNAKKEIEDLGHEVGALGIALGQVNRGLVTGSFSINSDVAELVKRCEILYRELKNFRDVLCAKPDLWQRLNWVLQAPELQYLQTQVLNMKINLLLMMTSVQLQNGRDPQRHSRERDQQVRRHSADTRDVVERLQQLEEQVRKLSAYSSVTIEQLQRLEEHFLDTNNDISASARNRMAINIVSTAMPLRTIRNSILANVSVDDHYEYLQDSLGMQIVDDESAQEASGDLARASLLIDDCLGAGNVSDEDLACEDSGEDTDSAESLDDEGLSFLRPCLPERNFRSPQEEDFKDLPQDPERAIMIVAPRKRLPHRSAITPENSGIFTGRGDEMSIKDVEPHLHTDEAQYRWQEPPNPVTELTTEDDWVLGRNTSNIPTQVIARDRPVDPSQRVYQHFVPSSAIGITNRSNEPVDSGREDHQLITRAKTIVPQPIDSLPGPTGLPFLSYEKGEILEILETDGYLGLGRCVDKAAGIGWVNGFHLEGHWVDKTLTKEGYYLIKSQPNEEESQPSSGDAMPELRSSEPWNGWGEWPSEWTE